MKRVISTLRFVLLFSNVIILLTLASAEMPEGLKNAMISHRQRHRVARSLAATTQKSQSRPVKRLAPDDSLTYNWAGATQSNIPGGSDTFNAVEAQWVVPNISPPPDAEGDDLWEVTAFAGIDGSVNCPQLLQGGTTSAVYYDEAGNLESYVIAFAEWFPDDQVVLILDVSFQDTVQVNIQATNSSQGIVEVINLTSGASNVSLLTAPSPDDNLCGLTADWIVEDATVEGELAPFAQFSPYNFVNCAAGTTNNLTTGLTGSSLVTMVDGDGNAIATPNLVSNTALTVTYG